MTGAGGMPCLFTGTPQYPEGYPMGDDKNSGSGII
jgi:hypothetical protein